MDLIREISLTLSKKSYRNFIKFFTRKRPSDSRKDVQVFEELANYYKSSSYKKLPYKGAANYHAIRKRITKELINFLIIENTESKFKSTNREGMLTLAKYFIDFKKYSESWEVLNKQEKLSEKSNDYLISLKIQRLKLEILPYYPDGDFNSIKKKILELQKKQAQVDEFQLYFIQMKNLFIEKIKNGDVSFSSNEYEKSLLEFENLKTEINDPQIHLKNIEIIRVEYAIEKNYNDLAIILENYYNELDFELDNLKYQKHYANIEYIMSYTYLDIRDFKNSKKHLKRLHDLMLIENKIFYSYLGRYVAIDSFIKVFDHQINEAINVIQDTINQYNEKLNLREALNLLLNLSALLLINHDYKQANKLLNQFNRSDAYYQKTMGREWQLRKEMIRALILLELKHIDLAEKTLISIKQKYADLFPSKQYKMVYPFITALEKFMNEPELINLEELKTLEKASDFQSKKVFKDPRLIMFYSWLKGKYTNQKTYDVLLNEYNLLD